MTPKTIPETLASGNDAIEKSKRVLAKSPIDTTKVFPLYNKPSDYAVAFSFLVGTITTRERLELHPLSAKELLQLVYNNTGVAPIESVVKELGLTL